MKLEFHNNLARDANKNSDFRANSVVNRCKLNFNNSLNNFTERTYKISNTGNIRLRRPYGVVCSFVLVKYRQMAFAS